MSYGTGTARFATSVAATFFFKAAPVADALAIGTLVGRGTASATHSTAVVATALVRAVWCALTGETIASKTSLTIPAIAAASIVAALFGCAIRRADTLVF